MHIGDIIGFRDDLFFEGAVQIDWFYNQLKAAKVAESFVFHGSEYFGVSDEQTGSKMTDTVSFFKTIASKIEDDQRGNPFTLAIAEYGTGKSHLAVALAQVLSGKDYMPQTYKKLIENIRRIDVEATKDIEAIGEKPNLILTINGMRDFNLHYEILRAASRSIKLYGYSDENLKKLNRAHEIAFRFLERNIATSTALFEQQAESYQWAEKGQALAERLRKTLSEDKYAFEIINKVYQEINGHEIRWDEGVSAMSVLETLLTEYCGISGVFNKIVIIFDEFGRYLEYASSADSAQTGDSALQQIFEAVQNADGNIQMINFIQSDIKAYLQRVDKTRNISRYIGRFDASDKYHLSSNLETVFANLIDRKDKDSFDRYIKVWQNTHESEWVATYEKMDQWLPLKGLWKDYSLFRQVIVEGIYPMHPLSTYMLTGLSGYLQNRSSLTLVNKFISLLSSYKIDENSGCPIVLPEQLLDGDLYSEMLAAEQEGRQLSRHCIRYDNVLRKSGEKLTENMCKILRSNLVLKLLRFRTTNYEDAKLALSICSGLSITEVEEELVWLENEYAILGFDEHTSSFDFLEDSSGAHDFRTFYRRIKSGQKLSKAIFDDSNIREIAGILTNVSTNFSIENKIKSNEWQFTQDLFHIDEISDAYVDSLISDFRNSTAPEKVKGKLIWLYINKDTDIKRLDNVQRLSNKINGMPILIFLLNDVENKLYSALLEYDVLSKQISNEDKARFGHHYSDAFMQAENVLRDTFDVLQRERIAVTPDGTKQLSSRLAVSLSEILSNIYPNVVPFDFDGFDSKQPGRAKKAFCSILKLLLSGSINANTIQSSPVEVRNRFEATLFETGKNSWKCVNSNYQIMPPKNKRVFLIYNFLEEKLKKDQELDCNYIFNKLSMPPFGLNDYIILFIISVFCANLNYCLRVKYKDETYSIMKWKDIVVGDSKISISILKESHFLLVDAGAVIDNYLRLFKQVENNDNVNLVTKYYNELNQLAQSDEIPTELEAQYKLCEYRLNEGKKVLSRWNTVIDDLHTKYETVLEDGDLYVGLQAIGTIYNPSIYSIFNERYVIQDEQKKMLQDFRDRFKNYVDPRLKNWIKDQRCYSVESMSQYKKHYKRITALLQELGYFEHAEFAEKHGESELQNREAIRDRQELKTNYGKFMSEKVVTNFVAYTTLIEWEKQGLDLLDKAEKYKDSLGSDYLNLTNKLTTRINDIANAYKKIKCDMDDIWNDIYELTDIDMVESMIERIDYVCKKGIPLSDRSDFVDLQKVFEEFIADSKELQNLGLDRMAFEVKLKNLLEKYSEDDVEIDVLHILKSIADTCVNNMNVKENDWCQKFISTINENVNRQDALKWIDNTMSLPTYLTESSIEKYTHTKKQIDKILSEANIDDVIFYYQKLNQYEREKCVARIMEICHK
ncbi:hypothetical protein RBG61_13135 [Paludicola sp. MB14-C6]|uniref:hypothetical protein n=1 Tax=Paludihabitans sp. MB14-C6 TaxID=3070656 RepID=UPI0027DCD922|nr:hypothetical protein [Paludicola sp. MB14-C6]WMJ22918.1 hypothetical protein RBG61_13135 [Paludicola sp. MB14-C6]